MCVCVCVCVCVLECVSVCQCVSVCVPLPCRCSVVVSLHGSSRVSSLFNPLLCSIKRYSINLYTANGLTNRESKRTGVSDKNGVGGDGEGRGRGVSKPGKVWIQKIPTEKILSCAKQSQSAQRITETPSS